MLLLKILVYGLFFMKKIKTFMIKVNNKNKKFLSFYIIDNISKWHPNEEINKKVALWTGDSIIFNNIC